MYKEIMLCISLIQIVPFLDSLKWKRWLNLYIFASDCTREETNYLTVGREGWGIPTIVNASKRTK